MKKLILLLVCLFVSILVFGQSEKVFENEYEKIEVSPPQFTGVQNAAAIFGTENSNLVREFLLKNTVYPEKASLCMKEGTEVVKFQVSTTGELSNFKIVNSICPEIDDEVIRVLKSTDGMWKPGLRDGKLVAMEKEISMVFNLENIKGVSLEEQFAKKATAYFNKANKQLLVKQKPRKALKNYQMAMRYLPYEDCLLYASGLCKYKLNDKEAAEEDWSRMRHLTAEGKSQQTLDFAMEDYEKLQGFEERQGYSIK